MTQPTMRRLNRSSTKARYNQPAPVDIGHVACPDGIGVCTPRSRHLLSRGHQTNRLLIVLQRIPPTRQLLHHSLCDWERIPLAVQPGRFCRGVMPGKVTVRRP
jgi:hypothetical protein